jgi:serine/threonine protein kinase
MELCDTNLHNYIYEDWDELSAIKMPQFTAVTSLGPLAQVCQTFNIMIDILNGITYVHNEGYVHRDLKPKNGIHTYPCNY